MCEKRIDCPMCNGAAIVVTKGHVEMNQCDHCGWTQTSNIFPESDVALIDGSPESVVVQINWASQCKIGREVVLARQLFKPLGDTSLSYVLQQAKESNTFTLGTFPLPIAIDMQERARENGISMKFVKIPPIQ